MDSQQSDLSSQDQVCAAPHQPSLRSKCAVALSTVTHAALFVCLGLISVCGDSHETQNGTLAAAFEDDVRQQELERTVPLTEAAEQFDNADAGGQDAAFALLNQRSPASVFRAQTLTASDFPVEQTAWSTADLSQHVAGFRGVTGTASQTGSGTGDGNAAGAGSGSGFFGKAVDGRRFVFVLDCSRSMNHPHDSEAKTRFKRLKQELVHSIASMTDEQEFYIVFFSDGPITMPAPGPVAATYGAKQRYLSWMQTLSADGNTDPSAAMHLTLRFQPDVVYFLTDGSFVHKTQLDLLRLPFGQAKLHTFAFEEVFEGPLLDAYRLLVDGQRDAAKAAMPSRYGFRKVELAADSVLYLKRLAERHNGTFHLIPHSE